MIPYEDLLNRSPNAYVVLDRAYRIVWMNEAYLAVTGRQRDELIGRAMFEAFPSEEASESQRQLRASFDRTFRDARVDEVPHIRYDLADENGEMVERYWSATHTPILDEHGEAVQLLQHTVDVTELHNLRRLRDEVGLMERARSVTARMNALEDEAETLRAMFEQAPGFVAMLEGADHRFVMTNAAYRTLVMRDDLVGRTVAEALPEVVEQGFLDILDTVVATGEPYFGVREPVSLYGGEGRARRELMLQFVFQPVRLNGQDVSGVLIQGYDVTAEHQAAERQQLLIDELNHRVKNTLAIVQSLAQQTFSAAATDPGPMKAFNARLAALAAAHNLLTQCSWKAAELKDIVCDALSATAGPAKARVAVDGPQVTLGPQQAVSMAMIVHELATNALKYGGLSNETGTVSVQWSVDNRDSHTDLNLCWTEHGGPPATNPARKGFGSRLIRHGLGSGSATRLDFEPDGFAYHMSARL
ncbi:sensor histidine kinase [Qipengyuania thermophila]|uniref:sensor histidine kinase n=1 Tax=Qipengyuania thermophila TaxID=2509361 RepID=UPI001F3FE719|nr:PAS domain-containing protein [Qipengyuania thermophila]